MITVLLVDDNGPIRKSLRSLLKGADDMQVVATATNGADGVEKARSLRPNVAVIDISMPIMDGIEATDHIRECCRLTHVIILSGYNNPAYIERSLEVGAKGYVLKDTMGDELLNAIRAVQQGSHYFSEQIAAIAANYLGPT